MTFLLFSFLSQIVYAKGRAINRRIRKIYRRGFPSRSVSTIEEIILSTCAPESRDNTRGLERNKFIREYYLFFCFIGICAMSICQMNPSHVFVFYASYILIYICLLIYISIICILYIQIFSALHDT